MPKVLENVQIAPEVFRLVVEVPRIARKRRAGQFVVVRANEESERIPLTIAGASPEEGTITLIIQRVGASTAEIVSHEAGSELKDVAGPLGHPTELLEKGLAVCVGGGIGVAPILPIAAALRERGVRVISIIGARTRDLLILEDAVRAVSDEVIVTTDDGSIGRKAVVTEPLKELLEREKVDAVYAVGPVVMMKFVAAATRPFAVKTIVSLNPIMVDGTGMCGGCRVTIAGKTRFVCVDGPEFDGHQVDFEGLMKRLATYRDAEAQGKLHIEHEHGVCLIGRKQG